MLIKVLASIVSQIITLFLIFVAVLQLRFYNNKHAKLTAIRIIFLIKVTEFAIVILRFLNLKIYRMLYWLYIMFDRI